MSSSDQSPTHCDHKPCKIEEPHCHICCDHDNCEIDRPHCHVCFEKAAHEPVAQRPSLTEFRNDTQPGSIKHQEMVQAEDGGREPVVEVDVDEDICPPEEFHSALWQPSYAVGGGTDLTKTLRPTRYRMFSWGGPGSHITIPSPGDSRRSSAPESGGEERPQRPQVMHTQSSRMRDLLRKKLDDRIQPPGTPPLRGTPIRPSPMTTSPVQTPPEDEAKPSGESMTEKRPKIVRGLSKGVKKARGMTP